MQKQMGNAQVLMQENEMRLQGHIHFNNAEAIYQNGLALIQQAKQFPIQLNLSALDHGNTLVLAVIVQWLRHCPNHQALQLVDVPQKMLGILAVSNLTHLMQ